MLSEYSTRPKCSRVGRPLLRLERQRGSAALAIRITRVCRPHNPHRNVSARCGQQPVDFIDRAQLGVAQLKQNIPGPNPRPRCRPVRYHAHRLDSDRLVEAVRTLEKACYGEHLAAEAQVRTAHVAMREQF
eukprot:scaffold61075_cov36-Tisochrysis_lutea.AAC.1